MGVQPSTEQERADIKKTVESLGSGHFSTDQIERHHRALMKAAGRGPMHPVRIGQLLREYGAISKPKWDGSKARKEGKRPGYMVKGWIL